MNTAKATAITTLLSVGALLIAAPAAAQNAAPAPQPTPEAIAAAANGPQPILNPPVAPKTPATPTFPAAKLTPAQQAAIKNLPNPGAIPFTDFDSLPWSGTAGRGNQTYTLYGSTGQPGPYAILMKWWPGSFSSPHFHTQTRYITVIKGTWWVSASTKKDMTTLFPLPEGTVVRDEAFTVHWDGAQGEPVILQISGNGPAGSIGVDEAGKVVPRVPRPAGAPPAAAD